MKQPLANKQERVRESSVVLAKMASKGFEIALGSLYALYGQKTHNNENFLGALSGPLLVDSPFGAPVVGVPLLGGPSGRGPLVFEPMCPKLRYATGIK